jgi:hypothetical protein
MEIERTGTLVQVAGKIMKMNPPAAFDGLGRVTDAYAKFYDGFVNCNIAKRNFVAAGNFFTGVNLPARRADKFNRTGNHIVNHGGDIVRRLDLETARLHLAWVIAFIKFRIS